MLRSKGWKPAPPPGQEFLVHAWRPSAEKETGYAHTVQGAKSLASAREAAEGLFRAGWVGAEIRENEG